ncbi:MAG: hypothetical protein IJB87_00895 [Alistipes sp.]|nr:hypothetical protein [Alistipes sp.]
MKNFLFILVLAFVLSSCSTVYKTASTEDVSTRIVSTTLADLEVSNQKITYTFKPVASVRRGGVQNCINVAISEALKEHGGDVLIETQKATVCRMSLFGFNRVKSVTVTGFPATYKNFNSVDQSLIKRSLENGSSL